MSRFLLQWADRARTFRRYQRQVTLPGFGEQGQTQLRSSSALVLGLGAVGSVAAVYLARSGIGRLGIVDFDEVDISNLHRQPFFDEQDVGHSKVEVLTSRLGDGESDIVLEPYTTKVDSPFLIETVPRYDVVLDAVDSFASKLEVNDAAWRARVPLVSGGVDGYVGQALAIAPMRSPCLRCIVHEAPDQLGEPLAVFPPIAAVVGSILASEGLKLLLGVGDPLVGRFLVVRATDWSTTVLPIGKRRGCPTCGFDI